MGIYPTVAIRASASAFADSKGSYAACADTQWDEYIYVGKFDSIPWELSHAHR